MRRLRHLDIVCLFAAVLAGAPMQTSAQLVVFDPSSYAQNVLTAARALQQINNQITSLENQALIANAQTRWQNSIAGLQDTMRVQATVVGNLNTNRTQMSALVGVSQGAT